MSIVSSNPNAYSKTSNVALVIVLGSKTASTTNGGPREEKHKIHWLPGNIAEGSRDRWQGVGGLL